MQGRSLAFLLTSRLGTELIIDVQRDPHVTDVVAIQCRESVDMPVALLG